MDNEADGVGPFCGQLNSSDSCQIQPSRLHDERQGKESTAQHLFCRPDLPLRGGLEEQHALQHDAQEIEGWWIKMATAIDQGYMMAFLGQLGSVGQGYAGFARRPTSFDFGDGAGSEPLEQGQGICLMFLPDRERSGQRLLASGQLLCCAQARALSFVPEKRQQTLFFLVTCCWELVGLHAIPHDVVLIICSVILSLLSS
jgi:hypothetical protein